MDLSRVYDFMFIYLCALIFEKIHLDLITCQKKHYLIFKGLIRFSFLLHPPAKHQRELLQHRTKKKVTFFLSPQFFINVFLNSRWVFLFCGLQGSCKSFWFIMDLYLFFSKLPWLGRSNMAITLRAFWGPIFAYASWHAWLSLVIPHFSLAMVFVVCGTSSRHVTKMKNCATKIMSERRRCHYYARGETWHEEAFNIKHLCIQQCLTKFLPHWTTHNGSLKMLQMCTLKLFFCKIRVSACVLKASLLETWSNIAKISLNCSLASTQLLASNNRIIL